MELSSRWGQDGTDRGNGARRIARVVAEAGLRPGFMYHFIITDKRALSEQSAQPGVAVLRKAACPVH